MPRINWKLCSGLLAVAALVTVSALQAEQQAAGVARISDGGADAVQPVNYQGCASGSCAAQPAPMPAPQPMATGCATGQCGTYAPGYQQRMSAVLGQGCNSGACAPSGGSCCSKGGSGCCGGGGSGCCLINCWHKQSMAYSQKNQALSQKLFGGCNAGSGSSSPADLFGWMVPSGCCGQGCPPAGQYGLVYANNPNYFDMRDGKLFGAPGYGTPMTVPLAPNVHHTWNYGWGVPSSRLTRISHPAGYSSLRPVHW